jgi:hypothetical protein
VTLFVKDGRREKNKEYTKCWSGIEKEEAILEDYELTYE